MDIKRALRKIKDEISFSSGMKCNSVMFDYYCGNNIGK